MTFPLYMQVDCYHTYFRNCTSNKDHPEVDIEMDRMTTPISLFGHGSHLGAMQKMVLSVSSEVVTPRGPLSLYISFGTCLPVT